MADVTGEQLRQVPLLAELGKKALAKVAGHMRERSLEAGSEVVTQGSRGVGFFVILDGEAEVSIDGEVRRTLGPGDYFGEIALITAAARSATVTATTDLRVAAITAWEFKPLVLEQPELAWTLLETLAERISEPAAAGAP